jgi:hypothetical protein
MGMPKYKSGVKYLFWYFLVIAYFRPEIAPEYGIEKEEGD